MGIFSKFENKMEDTFEGAADMLANAPISPVQIAKKAEKQMRRGKMVGAGKQYAPTLYTVLVNPDDDQRLFGYYPTLAGETETYLAAKASEQGLVMDGQPLVRFIVDDGLRHGKFEIIAEAVSAPIIAQLRAEEMQRYGLASQSQGRGHAAQQPPAQPRQQAYGAPPINFDDDAPASSLPSQKPPLPYVPENELDYSIDYGEYTFDSRDFEDKDADASAASAAASGARHAQVAAADAAAAGVASAAVASAGYRPAAAVQPPAIPQTMVLGAEVQQAAQAPAPARTRASLIDNTNGRTIPLTSPRLRIGRESASDIVLPDINASRTHAELRLGADGAWSLTDLRSTNGTYVNDREITTCTLSNGDRITVGTTSLTFTQG